MRCKQADVIAPDENCIDSTTEWIAREKRLECSIRTSVKIIEKRKRNIKKERKYKKGEKIFLKKEKKTTTIRRKLGELRQLKESAAEFAEEVQRLVTLPYPGVELDLQDQLNTDFFLKGLCHQKVAYEVMNKDPHSLVEAQRL